MPKAWKRQCLMCDGAGHVPVPCADCGQPASTRGVDPIRAICDACAHPCALCAHGTPSSDRLQFDGAAVVHVACGIRFSVEAGFEKDIGVISAQNIEGPLPAVESVTTHKRTSARASERAYVRALVEDALPYPSKRIVEMMAAAGFISVPEACRLSGHPGSTLYKWIQKKRLVSKRTGVFWWIERVGLVAICPQMTPEIANKTFKEAAR